MNEYARALLDEIMRSPAIHDGTGGGGLMPAADLDAPPPAGDDSLIARGFIQVSQANWVRLDEVEWVFFNVGPGPDYCKVRLRSGFTAQVEDDDARAFWVAWTRYLAGDD